MSNNMSDSPVSTRAVQTLGIIITSAISGCTIALTGLVIPRIMDSPTPLMLKQWKSIYGRAKIALPVLSAIASASFFYLTYDAHKAPASNVLPQKWKIYLASGVLTIGVIPYTLLIMGRPTRKLLTWAERTKGLAFDDDDVVGPPGEKTSHQLLDHWAKLNLVRSLAVSIAAIMGTWTALG